MDMLKEGDKAPDFELPDTNGKKTRLSDFRGRKVILYFYPKDNTPGCTKEACSFRDGYKELQKRGIVVLGISMDGKESHQKFTRKYSLPFQLLSDGRARVSEAYGVYRKKMMFGRSFFGIKRATFLIDEQGKVRHIFNKIDVAGHSKETMEAFKR